MPPLLLATSVVVALAAGAGLTHLRTNRIVATHDARVQAARTIISTQVAGTITKIDVRDGQFVKRGQVLLRLDDRRYRLAVLAARAQLLQARSRIAALRATYSQRLADLATATATLHDRQLELAEDQLLVPAGLLPEAVEAQARRAMHIAREDAADARDTAAATLAQLSGDATLPAAVYPMVRIARARLDHAMLQQSLTVIAAPSDGMVDGSGHLKPGSELKVGTPLLVLQSVRQLWIDAAFKETELGHVQPGEPALVRLADDPRRQWPAHVVSVSPETTAMLRGTPVNGAAADWRKVAQRVPVRLELDDAPGSGVLLPGARVEIAVDTQQRTPLLRLAARTLRSIGLLR